MAEEAERRQKRAEQKRKALDARDLDPEDPVWLEHSGRLEKDALRKKLKNDEVRRGIAKLRQAARGRRRSHGCRAAATLGCI